MNPLISIIVPVYNVENYIRKCLDSLVSQTYKNIEIILVDDCSTDNSYKICQEYAEADIRIRLIKNKKNMKQAASRNIGLKYAGGGTCYL